MEAVGSDADGQSDGQSGRSQPGEAWPGEVAAAGLRDTGEDHGPATWMEQGNTI